MSELWAALREATTKFRQRLQIKMSKYKIFKLQF